MESRGWCGTAPPCCSGAGSTPRGPRCQPRPDSCPSWTRWSTTWRAMRHRSPRRKASRGSSSGPVAPIPWGPRCSASTRANRTSRRRRRRSFARCWTPIWSTPPGSRPRASPAAPTRTPVELAGERIETVEALLSGRVRLLVTTARAGAERTGVPAALASLRLVLAAGRVPGAAGPGSFSAVIERLEAMGYARVSTVTEVAQFSVRGGILDVYGFGMAAPARVEWWGDEIQSLRAFDLDSQRSGEAIERVTVLPVKTEGGRAGDVGAQHAAP